MPYQLFWESSGAYILLSGEVTFDQIATANAMFYAGLDGRLVKYQLCNFLNVTRITLNITQAERIGKSDLVVSMSNGPMKLGIICDNPSFKKLHSAYMEYMKKSIWEVRIFSTEVDARNWAQNE